MESVKDRDEKFVGDFLGASMEIISKNITQNTQPAEKGSFMLMPKKVNKVRTCLNIDIFHSCSLEDDQRFSSLVPN